MNHSPEIEQLIRDSMAAYERGDVDFMERTTSKQSGVVGIGTDPNEYQRGYERLMKAGRDEMSGSPKIRFAIGEIHAYEHGDVGWADGTGYFESGGQSVEVRSTGVFLREDGQWRSVQNHSSIGVPNERMFDPLFQHHKTAT